MLYDFYSNKDKTLISINIETDSPILKGHCVVLTNQNRQQGQYRIVDVISRLESPGVKYNTLVMVKLENLYL